VVVAVLPLSVPPLWVKGPLKIKSPNPQLIVPPLSVADPVIVIFADPAVNVPVLIEKAVVGEVKFKVPVVQDIVPTYVPLMVRLSKNTLCVGITQLIDPLEKTTSSVAAGIPDGLQLAAVLQLVLLVETHVFVTA
jgi:hypothetical protein